MNHIIHHSESSKIGRHRTPRVLPAHWEFHLEEIRHLTGIAALKRCFKDGT